jgi:hypothetical protein
MMTPSNSIVLIKSGTIEHKQTFGTGFVICQAQDLSYVVTCAHVLDFPESIQVNEHSANIVAIGQGWLDIAVLEVKGLEAKTSLRLGISSSTGCSIKIPGISKLQASNDMSGIRLLNGVLGEPLSPISTSSGQILVQAWDLRINEGEYLLREGYSGSPVINAATGEAIAIVSHKAEKGEKGIAIAIQALANVWKDIPANLLQKKPLPEEQEMNQCEHISTRQLLFEHQQLKHQILVKTIEIETLDEKVLGITQDLQRVEPFTSLYRSLEKQKQSYQAELIPFRAEQKKLMTELEETMQELKKRGHQLEN